MRGRTCFLCAGGCLCLFEKMTKSMNELLDKKLGMCIIYSVGYTPCASIAQSVEHFTRNEGVEGSSPFRSFLYFVYNILFCILFSNCLHLQ